MGHSRPLFLYFCLLAVIVQYKILPMNGFEPRTSGVGSNCSTNWATTTARGKLLFEIQLSIATLLEFVNVEQLTLLKIGRQLLSSCFQKDFNRCLGLQCQSLTDLVSSEGWKTEWTAAAASRMTLPLVGDPRPDLRMRTVTTLLYKASMADLPL